MWPPFLFIHDGFFGYEIIQRFHVSTFTSRNSRLLKGHPDLEPFLNESGSGVETLPVNTSSVMDVQNLLFSFSVWVTRGMGSSFLPLHHNPGEKKNVFSKLAGTGNGHTVYVFERGASHQTFILDSVLLLRCR